jgi:uncharacterized protein YwgA
LFLQFQAIGPTQRDAILRALQEDVEKLVHEYGPYNQESSELKEALHHCEEIYRILSAQLEEQGMCLAISELGKLGMGLSIKYRLFTVANFLDLISRLSIFKLVPRFLEEFEKPMVGNSQYT